MTAVTTDRAEALKSAAVAFGEAWAKGDTVTLDSLLSPTYTHHDAFGARLDRAAWLAYASKRTGRDTKIELRDENYRYFGDVAIITGTNIVTGTGARNAADTAGLTIVFTQVWIWSTDRWLREAFQATPVVDDVYK